MEKESAAHELKEHEAEAKVEHAKLYAALKSHVKEDTKEHKEIAAKIRGEGKHSHDPYYASSKKNIGGKE